MQRILFALCCGIALFALPVKAQEPQSPRTAPTLPAVRSAMQSFVEAGEVSGVVTLVAQEGKVVHLGAVGKSDLESGQAMTPRNLFSIASMTKPIVATGLMMLVEEDALELDDPVSKYLPEFASLKLKNGEAPDREITIRDAITHTSGLNGSQLFAGSLSEGVEQLAKRPLAFQPGAKWQYSPGLNVCGRIVEVVSGERLDDFLQARLFDPLGMKDTTFYPTAAQRKRIATLYGPTESGTLEAVPNRISDIEVGDKSQGPNPSGGLFSTARDMFRFYKMVLNEGRFQGKQLIAADLARAMVAPQTGELKTGFTPGNCWGLGWCVIREPQGVTATLSSGTFGHGGAFGTQGWVDPETKTIYVLMIQRTKLPNSDGSDVRKSFHEAVQAAGTSG